MDSFQKFPRKTSLGITEGHIKPIRDADKNLTRNYSYLGKNTVDLFSFDVDEFRVERVKLQSVL